MLKIEFFKRLDGYLVIALFCLLTFFLHKQYLDEFPSYTHAWSQSDRYALANGFVDNDLNFFKPQTLVYNHPIPNDWNTADSTRITAVDFPIHDYIPAILMKVFGNKSPFFFRVYILIYGFIGLFFIYRLSNLLGNSKSISFFILIFAATSPVFVYYQSGFIPSIPSLSNAIIGIYFYYKYRESRLSKSFIISVLFLTLSALARTTFLIPLVAIVALELLKFIQLKTVELKILLISLASFLVILLYVFYNIYLRKTYGAMFLFSFKMANNFEELKEIVKLMFQRWFFHYFSWLHYLILGLISAFVLLFKRMYLKELYSKVKLSIQLLMLLLIGNIIFFLLMAKQFENHDYYFLDTFYLPIILLLILLFSLVEFKNVKILLFPTLLVISFFLLKNAKFMQEEKRITGTWDVVNESILNFKNSEGFLFKNGISKNEKVFVLGSFTPNIPFLLMNRTGYCNMHSNYLAIKQTLNFPVKYYIFQNEFFLQDIYAHYPKIINHLKMIATNGKITICKKERSNQNLEQFLQLDKRQPLIDLRKSNKKSIHISSSQEFEILLNTKNDMRFSENRVVKYSFKSKGKPFKDVSLVVSMVDGDSLVYYKCFSLNFNPKKEWNQNYNLFSLPNSNSTKNEFKIYFWNPNKEDILISNSDLTVY
jgi:hypothetical protein